jgi:hypothetical protein
MAPGELTLHIGDAIRAQALKLAGLDPDDMRVLAAAFPVRVQAGNELKDFIDRIGVRKPGTCGPLADDYLLDAGDDGRLFLAFQLRSGRRYAGRFAVGQLTRKLASVYRADPMLAGLGATALPGHPRPRPPPGRNPQRTATRSCANSWPRSSPKARA